MSRRKIIGLVLVLGIGIGTLVPIGMYLWYGNDKIENKISLDAAESVSANSPERKVYHFRLDQEVLSVLEGKPGTSGKVIVAGLNVHNWPKDILELAPKVEFYSLDEVQSFIDTVNEPLWQE
jgi:hypothetical protein